MRIAAKSCGVWVTGAVLAYVLTGCGTTAMTGTTPEDAPEVVSGRVVRIVDGDTAHIVIRGTREKVRFIGIDTPEATREVEPLGQEATARVVSATQGRRVWIETDAELRDEYGRLLAYVWLERPLSSSLDELRGKQLNAKLVAEGYASAYPHPPNTRYTNVYRALQQEARKAKRGLWAQ